MNTKQDPALPSDDEIRALSRDSESIRKKNSDLQQGQALLASIAQTLTQTISFQQKIDTILRLAGETLAVSRVYIFEDDYVNQVTINTHEWCAEGINPEIDNLQAIPMDFVFDWYRFIGEQGYVNTSNIATLPRNLQLVLEPQNVISIVVFKLQLPNGGTGFAGFDECIAEREWQRHELDILISITGIISSLYEQENLQRKLNAKEQNFTNMFNSITDFIFVADNDGYLIQVNDAVHENLVYDEVLADKGAVHILDLHPKSHREEATQVLQEMANGSSSQCKVPLQGKNGQEVPVETTSWLGEWNGKEALVGLSKDLSAEKEALDTFNKLFENNPLPIAVFNAKTTTYSRVNFAFVSLLGYTEQELLETAANRKDIFVGVDDYIDILKRLDKNDTLVSKSLQLRKKDGSIIEGLASGSFIHTKGALQFMVVFTDLTEQIALKGKLEDQSQRLEHIVNSAQLGTWEWDLTTDGLVINRRWAEMVGYSLAELGEPTISTWRALVHPEDSERTEQALQDHIQGKTSSYSTECRVRHRNGSYIWVRDTGRVMEYTGDKPTMMFGSHLDITLKKEAELRLLESKNRAEEENEAKSRFLAMVSHEIRTPIHTMQGITELLAKSRLTEKQKHYTLLLQQSSHIVLETINNTLDFSKIESDTIEMHVSPFYLNELSESLQNLFSFRFAQKGLELVTYMDPDTPLHILGDTFRLKQIIQNLMSNAEKYTTSGSVLFSIRPLAESEDTARIEFTVADTGMGIDSSSIGDLFVPYWQGSASQVKTTFAGSGLGLSIVKNLVTMMDGSISVESAVGKGSTFRCEIPFGKISDTTIRSQHEKREEKTYSRIYLQKSWQTEQLYKALKLLDVSVGYLKEEDSINTFGQEENPVIILDWNLISKESDSRKEELKKKMHEHTHCKYIILASVIDADTLVGCACSGFTYAIVKKPVGVLQVLTAIGELSEGRCHAEKFPHRRNARKFGSILVCEDHTVNREMIQELLMSVGYAVEGVASGIEAIEKMDSHEYDLLLLDLQMPGLDGFETAHIIRNKKGITTPIIAFTAHALPEYEKKSAKAGMNGYLVKPIIPAQLYETVDTWVERGANLRYSSDEKTEHLRQKMDALSEHVQQAFAVDLRDAMGRYLYNTSAYHKHLCYVREDIATLSEGLLASDVDKVALVQDLHALRGVVANLGFGAMAAKILSYESDVRSVQVGDKKGLVSQMYAYIIAQHVLVTEFVDFLQDHLQQEIPKPPSANEVVSSADLPNLCASIKEALALGDADKLAVLSKELSSHSFDMQVQEAGKVLAKHIDSYEFAEAEALVDSLLAEIEDRGNL